MNSIGHWWSIDDVHCNCSATLRLALILNAKTVFELEILQQSEIEKNIYILHFIKFKIQCNKKIYMDIFANGQIFFITLWFVCFFCCFLLLFRESFIIFQFNKFICREENTFRLIGWTLRDEKHFSENYVSQKNMSLLNISRDASFSEGRVSIICAISTVQHWKFLK